MMKKLSIQAEWPDGLFNILHNYLQHWNLLSSIKTDNLVFKFCAKFFLKKTT